MMKALRAALLGAALITSGSSPPDASVSLHVRVTGADLCGSRVILNMLDLNTGTAVMNELSDEPLTQQIRKGGEYILSLKECPPGFIPEEEILITKQQSRHDLQRTFFLKPLEVRIYQRIENTDLFAEGGKLELRDESDETVFVFEPDEEGYVRDEEGNEFAFEAGRSYVLSQKEDAEGYEDTGDLLLLIPEYRQEDEPLEFEFPVREITGTEETEQPDPLPAYAYMHTTPQILKPSLYEESDELTEPEAALEEPQIIPAIPASVPAAFVIPEIYLPGKSEKKESRKIESRIERTGFTVRLLNENRYYLKGARIAVYDADQNTVDEWETAEEDHLVSGDQIKADEIYTVHMVKPAQGYSASIPDIQHTAAAVQGDEYPLIELIDTPEKAAAASSAVKTEAAKKKLNLALYASGGAALCILGAVGAVFAFGRKS